MMKKIPERDLARLLLKEVMARLETRDPVRLDVPVAELIRQERESR